MRSVANASFAIMVGNISLLKRSRAWGKTAFSKSMVGGLAKVPVLGGSKSPASFGGRCLSVMVDVVCCAVGQPARNMMMEASLP
ncbi:hypothetical protein HMPREF2976_00015 [Corynebacterium sp. HMSC077D10]|nr:hypothetical protein HMPREF2748_02525 [Corynebacterium sp. HMSC077B05]OFP71196.1 hypothetical protein HMPREF2976_00015 [Corynebacterium sp. HMSC077D10]